MIACGGRGALGLLSAAFLRVHRARKPGALVAPRREVDLGSDLCRWNWSNALGGLRGNHRCRRRCPRVRPASPGLPAGACPVSPAHLPPRAPAWAPAMEGNAGGREPGEDGGKGGAVLRRLWHIVFGGLWILSPLQSLPAHQCFPCLLCRVATSRQPPLVSLASAATAVLTWRLTVWVPPPQGPCVGAGGLPVRLCVCASLMAQGRWKDKHCPRAAWPWGGEGGGMGCP